MPEEWKRTFVFLLKFNTTNVKEIAEKIATDKAKWTPGACEFMPVSGEYDVVVLAREGLTEDALKFAAYLTNTKRYTVASTLTVFGEDEFDYATGVTTVDPHRKG